jgi:hypothetical protein
MDDYRKVIHRYCTEAHLHSTPNEYIVHIESTEWHPTIHTKSTKYQNSRTYLSRVELNTGLDDIDGCESSVGNGAAQSTTGGSLEVVHEVIVGRTSSRRRCQEDGVGDSHSRY